MAGISDSEASSSPHGATPGKKTPQTGNPAFKMIGLPNFRFRLPSRNWMIFLTITSSFTAALIYDRREKRRAQQKWCDLVAHLSKEPLPVEQTRRKLTIFLAAPPGDGVRVAREYFQEYVKPILVAAALDYNVVEGRREGDVRIGLAERIRKQRRMAGEPSAVKEEQDVIEETRAKIGVHEEPGPQGDLVIGRHTWKEYIRGLHEGWLGPLDPPPEPVQETPEVSETAAPENPSPAAESTESNEANENKDKKQSTPSGPAPAYIQPAEYPSQSLPPTIPQAFEGSVPIAFPHILGFLNTPIRIYRYLNQRHLADTVGKEVAAIVLASATRPYSDTSVNTGLEPDAGPGNIPESSSRALLSENQVDNLSTRYEQQSALEHEEEEWHKSVYKRDESNPDKEREWLDDVVVDSRLALRMRRYILAPEEKIRAQRIHDGQEYILGEERPEIVPFWKRIWIKYGYGEDEQVGKKRPIIGNLDGEDGL